MIQLLKSDKEYFERLGRGNKLLPNSGPPTSLAETLKRMSELEKGQLKLEAICKDYESHD